LENEYTEWFDNDTKSFQFVDISTKSEEVGELIYKIFVLNNFQINILSHYYID
jgi:hypothetical protein